MLSQIEQILLFVSFFCLMVGIGCSLEMAQFQAVMQERKSFFWGLALQYLLLPSLACVLILLLGLEPLVGGALLLIACCPGGTTSNMFTYFSRANVSLSIFLTFTTTLAAFLVTPFLVAVFGQAFLSHGQPVSVPIKNLIVTLLVALVPVVVGFLIRLKSQPWALLTEKWGSRIGYLSIVLMVLIWYPKILETLQKQDLKVFAATGLLSFCGILFSLWISKGLGLSSANARTLSFETGIQNAPLAFAIISLNLPKPMALAIGWIPLLYGALSVGNAALFTALYLWLAQRKLKAVPA
jgi:predicted Na+-dependent transporter